MVSNANYVKKVVFPVDLLGPGTNRYRAVSYDTRNDSMGSIGHSFGGELYWTYFPVPHRIGSTCHDGFQDWLLSFRDQRLRPHDVGQVINVSVQLLMYLGPVILLREVLPQKFQWLMALNPITIPVEQFRRLPNLRDRPRWCSVAVLYVGSMCCGMVW